MRGNTLFDIMLCALCALFLMFFTAHAVGFMLSEQPRQLQPFECVNPTCDVHDPNKTI